MSKYFPNKWRKVANIPADKFEPLFYEDVMEWKVAGWELPRTLLVSSAHAISKTQN